MMWLVTTETWIGRVQKLFGGCVLAANRREEAFCLCQGHLFSILLSWLCSKPPTDYFIGLFNLYCKEYFCEVKYFLLSLYSCL